LKHILLFGAGKSSTCLIEYLLEQLPSNGWRLTVLDSNLFSAQDKVGDAPNAYAGFVNVANDEDRRKWIAEADVVISLLPPSLHILVAKDCLEFGKNLLTASYVDEKIRSLDNEIKQKGLLFLCECGLDPGIDHMSAMKLIDELKKEGALITSFRSHCGGLVAPESSDNPWNYKITWNPRNVVMAGKSGAIFREDGEEKQLNYEELFNANRVVDVPQLGLLSWYPNRDSLSYIPVYDLQTAHTFIRTTLRYPEFCFGWQNVITLKLTDETLMYDTDGLSLQRFFQKHMKENGFSDWMENQVAERIRLTHKLLEKLEQLMDAELQLDEKSMEALKDMMMVDESGNLMDLNLETVKSNAAATVAEQMHEANLAMKQLIYLGMNDGETMINKGRCSAADVLQFALEKKLALQPGDKDMVVMMHEINYELNGEEKQLNSSMVIRGDDSIRTAMAKTVGLPLGIATKLVLQEKLNVTGVQIPILPEIYEPVLKELEEFDIRFSDVVGS
jgi:saccharopine dehydrogenase-like NADP-dependent oxidoreductase